jgi:hypothetical protein
MEVAEHTMIVRGVWKALGVEVEEVGLEIDRSSPLLRHGQLMRTSSWEAATAVEEEDKETGCRVDLGQEGDLAGEEEGYQVDPEECDNRQRQSHSTELWEIASGLPKDGSCMARSSGLVTYWKVF